MAGTDVQELQTRYDAGGRGDFAEFFAHVHDDFEMVTPERGPLGATTIRGGDEEFDAYTDFYSPY